MSDKLTLSAGTDADSNSSITAVLQDETGNPLDTIIFSATNPKDQYSTYSLGEGLTVTRYGKLCILKGVNIQGFQFGIATLDSNGELKYNQDTNGFIDTGYVLPKEYSPKESKEFFYNGISWHDSSKLDSSTYWISLVISKDGSTGSSKIYARLERNIDASSTGHGSRNNVSFTLPYFTE